MLRELEIIVTAVCKLQTGGMTSAESGGGGEALPFISHCDDFHKLIIRRLRCQTEPGKVH